MPLNSSQDITNCSDIFIKNTAVDHKSILSRLQDAQKTKFLTDVTIGSVEGDISCHKNVLTSIYGYATGMNFDLSQFEIVLCSSSKKISSQVLEYIYTGIIYITQYNANDFLNLAQTLKITELVQESKDFLKSPAATHGKLIDHSKNVHQKIIKAFKSLWNDSASADVAVISNSTNYVCHRLILSMRSDYFYAMFVSNMEENRKGYVKLSHIEPTILKQILAYLYYQDISINCEDLFCLMEVADMLQLEDLCADITKSLVEKITVQNCTDIFIFSSQFHVYRSLHQNLKKYIQQKFLEVSRETSFLNLSDVNLKSILSTSSVLVHVPIVVLQALDNWCEHDVITRTGQLSDILLILKTQLNPSTYKDSQSSNNFTLEIKKHLCDIKHYHQVSPLQRLRPILNSANETDPLTLNDTIVMFVWTPSAQDGNTASGMQTLQTCCFVPDSNSEIGRWHCDKNYMNKVTSSKVSTYSMWTSMASLGHGKLLAVTQQRQFLLIELTTNTAKMISPPCTLKSYCQLVSLDNVAYLLVIDDSGFASFFSYNHDQNLWSTLNPPPSKISMSYRPIFAQCVGKVFLIEEHCEQIYEPTIDKWRTRKHTSIPSFQKLRDMKAVAFNEFLIISNWNNFFFYDTFTGIWARGNSEFQGIPVKCQGRLFSILPDFLTGSLTIKNIPSISASKDQLVKSCKELSQHIIGIQCVSVPLPPKNF